MNTFIDALNWRYATNKFDTTKMVSKEQLDSLLDAMILSPSSYGLQPWKFIVVSNPDIRKKLREAGYNQEKIEVSSYLIVFAVEKVLDDALVDTFIDSISKTRNIPVENLKGYADSIKGVIASKTRDQRIEWATRQAYIALGVLVSAGALAHIDVAPMEGFDPKKFDEILGLAEKGLESKVIAAVGFRASDDSRLDDKKVRFPKEKVVIEIK